MSTPQDPRRSRRGALRRRTAAVLSAFALAAAGYTAGTWRAGPDLPADTSVEAGFVRDMSIHHAQAVTLATLAAERATLPGVREMAEDIVLTQQREIGIMAGWLQQWGLPVLGTAPPMAWMRHGHASSAPDGDPPMPGMATRHDVAKLAVTRGPDADRLFCRLMLDHHLGGVHMITEIIARSNRPEVRTLAQQMRTDQGREIHQLRQLLDAFDTSVPGSTRGAPPSRDG